MVNFLQFDWNTTDTRWLEYKSKNVGNVLLHFAELQQLVCLKSCNLPSKSFNIVPTWFGFVLWKSILIHKILWTLLISVDCQQHSFFFLAYAGTVCDTGFGIICTEYREADSDLPSDISDGMGYVIIILSYM